MKGSNTVSKIKDLISPLAEEMGYFIWDVEYFKEGATWILRITIDSEDGITIDDCEKFSRAAGDAIDEADPIENSYTFQVSSPGIERELKTPMHIEACTGWDVEVKFYAPSPKAGGAKSMKGTLGGYDDDGNILIYTGERTEDGENGENGENGASGESGGKNVVKLVPTEIAGIKTYFDFD